MLREFYKEHFEAVILASREWPSNGNKWQVLWDVFRPDAPKPGDYSFSDDEKRLIISELKSRIANLPNLSDEQLTDPDFCFASCAFFHETGLSEIHKLKGGWELHLEAASDHPKEVHKYLWNAKTRKRYLLEIETVE